MLRAPNPSLFPYTTLFRSVSQINSHGWMVLAIGFVISFIVAYAAVAWFMAWVRKRGFAPFAVYRIIVRSEEHTSELQSLRHLVCRLLLEKKNQGHELLSVP